MMMNGAIFPEHYEFIHRPLISNIHATRVPHYSAIGGRHVIPASALSTVHLH